MNFDEPLVYLAICPWVLVKVDSVRGLIIPSTKGVGNWFKVYSVILNVYTPHFKHAHCHFHCVGQSCSTSTVSSYCYSSLSLSLLRWFKMIWSIVIHQFTRDNYCSNAYCYQSLTWCHHHDPYHFVSPWLVIYDPTLQPLGAWTLLINPYPSSDAAAARP